MIKIKDLQIGNVVQFTHRYTTRVGDKHVWEEVILEGTITDFSPNGVDCTIEEKEGWKHPVGEWRIVKIVS
jgi:hypothetical protein